MACFEMGFVNLERIVRFHVVINLDLVQKGIDICLNFGQYRMRSVADIFGRAFVGGQMF